MEFDEEFSGTPAEAAAEDLLNTSSINTSSINTSAVNTSGPMIKPPKPKREKKEPGKQTNSSVGFYNFVTESTFIIPFI